MMQHITSSENKYYKALKKLHSRSERYKQRRFLAEGQRIAADAVGSGAAEGLVYAQSYTGQVYTDLPGCRLPDRLFAALAETETPQGILAVCTMKNHRLQDVSGDTLVISDGISDPGNLGTLIRAAECSGASGVVLLKGTVDPYSPKTVRSTMGSIFRIPLYFCEAGDLKLLGDYQLASLVLDGSVSLFDAPFAPKTAVVIGSEANGVSREVAALSALRVRIPMRGAAESLNAGVSGGIVLYELYRRKLKEQG